MFVSVCTFRRRRRDGLERGIAIGPDSSDITTVIDDGGNRINLLHDYDLVPAEGCFIASLHPVPAKGQQVGGFVDMKGEGT